MLTVISPVGDGCDGDAALEDVLVLVGERAQRDVAAVGPPPDGDLARVDDAQVGHQVPHDLDLRVRLTGAMGAGEVLVRHSVICVVKTSKCHVTS